MSRRTASPWLAERDDSVVVAGQDPGTGIEADPVMSDGMWRSLVARSLREREDAGSNPAIPTGRILRAPREMRCHRGVVMSFLDVAPPAFVRLVVHLDQMRNQQPGMDKGLSATPATPHTYIRMGVTAWKVIKARRVSRE